MIIYRGTVNFNSKVNVMTLSAGVMWIFLTYNYKRNLHYMVQINGSKTINYLIHPELARQMLKIYIRN